MSEAKKKSRPFLRGLAVLLPSVLTLWLLVKAYQFVDSAIAEPINTGIRTAFIQIPKHFPDLANSLAIAPNAELLDARAMEQNISTTDVDAMQELSNIIFAESVNSWWAEHPWMNLLGLLVAAIIVYISGRLVGGFLGRSIYKRIEKLMVAVPVIRKIYPYVKQLVDLIQQLQTKIIAVGIESQEEKYFIEGLRVDGIQGYFISAPAELSQLTPSIYR